MHLRFRRQQVIEFLPKNTSELAWGLQCTCSACATAPLPATSSAPPNADDPGPQNICWVLMCDELPVLYCPTTARCWCRTHFHTARRTSFFGRIKKEHSVFSLIVRLFVFDPFLDAIVLPGVPHATFDVEEAATTTVPCFCCPPSLLPASGTILSLTATTVLFTCFKLNKLIQVTQVGCAMTYACASW
jgi:hypothetical protein